MKTLKIGLVLVLGLSIVASKPTKKPHPKDLKLRRLLDLLDEFVDKRGQNPGNEVSEDNKERQTVHTNGTDVKPKNIHVNKKQQQADNHDRHPLAPPPPPVNKRGESGIETRNFGISPSSLWPGGVIPYEIDETSFGSRLSTAVDRIQATASNISATTCVRWRLKTVDDQYFVRFTGDTSGCWSYVGNIRRDGGQPLGLGSGCLSGYIILHEMQHAMGGIHEQQRDRRKYFVKINWENIRPDYNNQYALSQHTINNEPYDYRSILQYHLTAFTSNGKVTMTIPDPDLTYLITNSKYVLSYYDLAEINKVYNCPTAACTLDCKYGGFRKRPLAQAACSCHCPTGLKGVTCEELDTDPDCGGIINLSNGGSDEIKMTSYTTGKECTWLVKGEPNSIMTATVTSVDLPFDSNNDCHHWLEFRDYLIGNDGKELCGQSTVPKTYTQTNIGEYSPFMIRFNSKNAFTPGTGFTIKVEAIQSGCMSSPCKTGSLCSENGGGGAYTCACTNGMSGTNCDEFRAPSYNLCDTEDDYGTCLFDQDNSGDIIWSFNTKLCDWRGCDNGVLTRGTGYQFLTLTPYYDSVQWNYGSKALITTSATFTAVDRCLSFEYAIGNYVQGDWLTKLNVYVEGTGKAKTNIKNIQTTTNYAWQTDSVSIEAVANMVITIEGVIGPQLIGVDNISLRPGLCTNTPCNPNPCQNSGTCDESNPPEGTKYVCSCTSGFSGDRCEVSQTDHCANSPCKNGGTCTSGSTTFTCQCDGTGYTGDTCEESISTNPCDQHQCLNGATCQADNTKPDGYRCDCDTGYTGDKCQAIDYCANSPCKNGGTCTSGSTTFTCQCDSTGYTGDTCEESISTNPCDQHQCLNGATCQADNTKPDGYRCDCDTGYTGDKCQAIDYCANSPCKNGGTCTSGSTTFTCQCDSTGYTGDTCEESISTNPCDQHQCLNGATCQADNTKPDGYRCDCDTGYTGDKCQAIDYCANSPCKNGGTCTSGSTTFNCQCDSTGYTGDTCEESISTNPCDQHQCLNGATCQADNTKPDGYRCDCDTGYTGDKCQEIDYCANSPCKNGGTCTSGSTTFTCQCDSTGFTGDTCEEPIPTNPCDQHQCMNGATCQADTTKPDGYRCDCDTGYTGDKCEDPITDPCDQNECMNGATCQADTTKPGGYRCDCDTGYTGDKCQDIDTGNPCDNNPCQNGGSCVETPGEEDPYRCDCPAGYPGSHCEGRSCTFEKKNDPACFLDTQDSTSFWRRKRRRTPSRRTGPRKAYEGQYYYYFEASKRTPGDPYYFFDNGVLFENKVHCLSLYYHMKGSGMGTFAIYTYKTSYVEHFSISGNQGNQWHKLELDLPLDEQTYIMVMAVRGDTFRSDIAIDDVKLMPNPCSD
ncbi:fibropellin-1-like [Ostrea edulis]|uniref:fibropellin-1-like n=1 Tax=Ostrea edulis TaxID=37623 RepID=UPI0024AEC69D|nr:fibropellin-1-like [Ostrea edulis]